MPLPFEIGRERSGVFLNFHGREIPLPAGWESWNAHLHGQLVGSLSIQCASAAELDWEQTDYEGPFFRAGAEVASLDAEQQVAMLCCVYIAPALRGRELWPLYAEILAGYALPVYTNFANPRLRERFQREHRPAELVLSA